jgi:8-oxo-dGTP pyrophosphatase MutT (NUDIX family)
MFTNYTPELIESILNPLKLTPNSISCRNPNFDPTPDEYLNRDGYYYTETTPKDQGDYGKAIAICTDQRFEELVEIYSPSASIGICQLNNGKFVLIFKNKPKVKGFALPGGTLGIVNANSKDLTQLQRCVVYTQALEREFMEECGIRLSQSHLLSTEYPTPRLNHACAVFLCKGDIVQEQREEDKDHFIVQVTYDEMMSALTGSLAIDAFLVPLLTVEDNYIRKCFS